MTKGKIPVTSPSAEASTLKNYAEVVKNIQAQAKLFESIIEFSNELSELGSLNNAISESKSRLDGLRKDCDASAAELETTKAKLAKLVAEAADREREFIAKSQADGAAIVGRAKQESEKIVRSAIESAENVAKDAQGKADAVGVQIQAKTAELDKVNLAITAATAELAELEKAIEAIKKKFA
jgi:chromosome segregation ATPase